MSVGRTIEVGGFWVVASLAALTAVSAIGPARASEIFVCDDQSVIYVTAKNRAAMADHPCVKGWFERNRGTTRRAPAKGAVAGVNAASAEPAVAAAPAPAAGDKTSAQPATDRSAAATSAAAEDTKSPSVTRAGNRRRSF